jgi:hypothetical protein
MKVPTARRRRPVGEVRNAFLVLYIRVHLLKATREDEEKIHGTRVTDEVQKKDEVARTGIRLQVNILALVPLRW